MEKKTIVIFDEEEQKIIDQVYFDAASDVCNNPGADELIEACTFDENNKVTSVPDDGDWHEAYYQILSPIAEIDFHSSGLDSEVAEEAWNIDENAWNGEEDHFEAVKKLYNEAGALDVFGDKLVKLISICCDQGW